MDQLVEKLISSSSKSFDLTDPKDHQSLDDLTEKILELRPEQFQAIENNIADKSLPVEFRMAFYLASSRKKIINIHSTVRVGVIFAMWGEQNRLLPRSVDNPNGEDTLRTKVRQLFKVTKDTDIKWKLYAVDDGCPYKSGEIAQKIVKDEGLEEFVEVLFLKDLINEDRGPLKNLKDVDDSRKGGAIIAGAAKALEEGNDAVIYTDADNSVHLGQIGLLLDEYARNGFQAVWGNRKDPRSVLVKQEERWGIGIKLLRHMQRMVGQSIFGLGLKDTQAAFKLFDAPLVSKIIENPSVYDFSFDSDWIAQTILSKASFTTVPFAFVDSFAESASIVQGPMSTWETLLLGLVKSMESRGLDHNTEMAAILKQEIQSVEDLELLIDKLPDQLQDISDDQLGDPNIMSPAEVQEWIGIQKR